MQREVVDFFGESFEDGIDVNACLEGGAKERDQDLFPEGKGRNVGSCDGRETFGQEAQIGCCFMKERDPVVEVASGREGRE